MLTGPVRQPRRTRDSAGPRRAPHTETLPRVQTSVETLQRALGNRAASRLVATAGPPLPVLARLTLHRADTGIKAKSATNHFAKAVFDYCQAEGNQAKTVDEFRTFLVDSVNRQLKGAGSCAVGVVDGAPGASGEFDFATWNLELNNASAFPGARTVADLSDDQISEVADTVYHESRHSEQWFRIARNKAGKALQQDADDRARRRVAAQIATDMGIPDRIALEACQRPLYASWSSKFGGQQDQKLEEAEAWEASIYGVNRTYRNEIVLGDFNDNVEKLNDLLEEANNLYPPNFDTLAGPAQQKIIKGAKKKVKEAKPFKDAIVADDASLLQPELDRLNALNPKNAVDTTMIGHLTVVQAKIKRIRANFRGSVPEKLEKAATAAEEMKDEMYQAYRDLPEEADAWPAGEAVAAEYGRLKGGG